MSATVAVVLKKIAVYMLTDKKVLKVIGGIVLGIVIIIIMPIVAVVSIFNSDINIDTDRLQQMIVENMSVEEQSELQNFDTTAKNIEEAMKKAGYADQIDTAQFLYFYALPEHSFEPDFVTKLVGCFSPGQTSEQLIEAVNAAFGTNIQT